MPTDAYVNDDAYENIDPDFLDRDEAADVPSVPGRARRRVAALTGVMLVAPDEVADFLVAQRPSRARDGSLRPEFFPGKRFLLMHDGAVAKASFNTSGWFRSTVYGVGDIDSLHAAFERVRTGRDADGDASYVLMGDIAPGADPRSAPRSKAAAVKDGRHKPRGLVDAARHWIVLDVDRVPNVIGVDPRDGAEARLAAISFLRSFLPPELRAARCSWQLSASCCVRGIDGCPLPAGQAPATLGAHLRYWFDDALDEAARKSLLSRLKVYVRSSLLAQAIFTDAGAGVDPATAIYNQAIFLRASFEAGLVDPLPERSGLIAEGRDHVWLDLLDEQLPELQTAAPKTRKPQTEKTASEQQAKADRREHDGLLRGARRVRLPAPATAEATTPEADPVPGVRLNRRPRSRAPQDRVLHASRIGKLADIVAITDDRRGRYPAWSNGVPVGMRRRTMLVVAGLLSHLVPVGELPRAIEDYGLHLTSRGWLDEEWIARRQDEHIIRKAELAAAAERAGVDGSGLREDPWLERIMALFGPTHDEMVRLSLRSLRTDAARKEVARRARGVRTAAERREQEAVSSEAATQPWIALNCSERTYRRRKKFAAADAFAWAVDPATASLSLLGLRDVIDFVRLARNPDDRPALARLAEGPLAGCGLGQFPAYLSAEDALACRGSETKDDRLMAIARFLSTLAQVGRMGESAHAIVGWLLTGIPAYLAWAHTHRAAEDAVVSTTELLERAEAEPNIRTFLATIDTTPATANCERVAVGSSRVRIPGDGRVGVVVGQTPAEPYPGRDIAGCSRATWARRNKLVWVTRDVAVEVVVALTVPEQAQYVVRVQDMTAEEIAAEIPF